MNGRHYEFVCEYREGSSFEGNVHELGIVSVTSSSVRGPYPAHSVVDFNNSSVALTNGERNEWICSDFKRKQVNLHHYLLRSWNDSDCYYLTNWVIEGSVDGTAWMELDQRNNCRDLVGLNLSQSFAVSGTGFFRLIRLRQTGKDSSRYDYLTLGAFELFGIVRTARE
jgi:hypothetical protein